MCQHRFAFTPSKYLNDPGTTSAPPRVLRVLSLRVFSSAVYSPDMPSRLPVQDIFAGLLTSVGTAIRYWFHYTLVACAWLGVVPLTACRCSLAGCGWDWNL